MDVGLILSMGKVYGDDYAKKVNPRRLYRKAKRMWNSHDPATKTWGKGLKMKFEKTTKQGVKNDGSN
jgi:hypothetical protein